MKRFRNLVKGKKVVNRALCFALSFMLAAGGNSLNVHAGQVDETVSDEAATIRMTSTEGDVTVKDSTGKELSKVDNMRLYSGNHIITDEESYAFFNLDDKKAVKLIDLSEAEIRQKDQKLQLLLDAGEIYLDVKEKLEQKKTLSIRSSNMVMGIRGTKTSAAVVDLHKVRLNVYLGETECDIVDLATGNRKHITIEGGQTADLNVDQTGNIQAEINKTDPNLVSGAIIEELKDSAEQIFNETGIDYGVFSDDDIKNKKKNESEGRAKKNREVKKAEAEQDNNRNTEDGYWENSTSGATPKPPTPQPQPQPQPQAQEPENTQVEPQPAAEQQTPASSNEPSSSESPSENTSNNNEEEPQPEKYKIKVGDTENGEVTVNKDEAEKGETVTVKVKPADGYKLKKLRVVNKEKDKDLNIDQISEKPIKYEFTMPASKVVVKATFEKKEEEQQEETKYNVNIDSLEHGSITADKSTAAKDETVTLTITPDEGYELKSIGASGASGEVALSGDGNTRTFTMPAEDVTVSGMFEAIQYTITLNNENLQASATTATVGETVTITGPFSLIENNEVAAQFATMSVQYSGGDLKVDITRDENPVEGSITATFTMPADNVSVSATYTGDRCYIEGPYDNGIYTNGNDGDRVGTYTIYVYGKEVSPDWPPVVGSPVVISVNITDSNFVLTGFSILKGGNAQAESIPVTDNGDGTYSFTAISGDVTLQFSVERL